MNYEFYVLLDCALQIIGLTISFLGLILALKIRQFDRWNRNYFALLFSILIISLGSSLANSLSGNSTVPDLSSPSGIYYLISTLSSSLLMPMLSVIISQDQTSDRQKSVRFTMLMKVSAVLWVIYAIMIIITMYTHTTNIIVFVPALLITAANITAVIRRWQSLTKRQRIAYIIFAILPFAGTIIYAVASFHMFVLLLEDHIDGVIEEVKKNSEQKISIMALQMRPHFIYNVLTSIYYLCDKDSGKAKSTILDFTNYLRRNFTAISIKEAVPFDDELEHTRAYISIEQVRFEDQIHVNYDLNCTDFKIPSLTLQPLVENAVKHGMGPENDSVDITIRTTRSDGSVKIIVENTGAEFAKTDNSDPHIALDNIRERLQLMCRGTLEIMPRDGGGTAVTITIPE